MSMFSSAVSLTAAAGLCLLAACSSPEEKSGEYPYKNPELSFEERADDLVSRMTLEEKVGQMVNDAPAIERLGIPSYNWWNECLHGVARSGRATVFPQAIGLAATWDTGLMNRVAECISDEARAKYHDYIRRGKRGMYQGLTFWSPNINIFRDPRWGRGMETYGEDPLLTGLMGVAFCRGLEGDDPRYLKVVSTPKHFAVHSGPEPDRHTFDASVSMMDLAETYLPQFRMCIEEANASSVMCAYNSYQGEACCANAYLLQNILRNRWRFKGYVVSDCGAIHDIHANHRMVETSPEAAAVAVRAGCDINCGNTYKNLIEAVAEGYITEAGVDVAVKRLFMARFRLGMFDPPEMVGYSNIPLDVLDSPDHEALTLEAARKSIVLLKNDGGLLPLKKNLGTIAVIGPNADDVETLLGNYNGTPVDPVTPLRGIREKVGESTAVLYSLGCEWADNMHHMDVIPSSVLYADEDRSVHGLSGEYFDNRSFEGDPLFSDIDETVNFNWWDGAPDTRMDDDDFSVRWSGWLVPEVTGTYILGARGMTGFRVSLDGEELIAFEGIYEPRTMQHAVRLEAGKAYRIVVEYWQTLREAHMALLWSPAGRDYRREAIEAAKKADVVVMCMGLSPRLEGEEMPVEIKGFSGGDRTDITLPDRQVALMKAIRRLGKPMVLVLLNGSALAVNWADGNVPAIVEAWYPGQAAGRALADVLFGDANPGGRLPVTFYRSLSQLPPFGDYNMAGRTYRYFEGRPLYPFGHGLSYTTFGYSGLTVPETVRSGEAVPVSVTVANTGDVAGDEVVQLYLSDMEASSPVPLRSLKGFARVRLEPGEERVVTFEITPRDLSLIDDTGRRIIEPGGFEIAVGGKQPGFSGTADAPTTGVVTASFAVEGEETELEW